MRKSRCCCRIRCFPLQIWLTLDNFGEFKTILIRCDSLFTCHLFLYFCRRSLIWNDHFRKKIAFWQANDYVLHYAFPTDEPTKKLSAKYFLFKSLNHSSLTTQLEWFKNNVQNDCLSLYVYKNNLNAIFLARLTRTLWTETGKTIQTNEIFVSMKVQGNTDAPASDAVQLVQVLFIIFANLLILYDWLLCGRLAQNSCWILWTSYSIVLIFMPFCCVCGGIITWITTGRAWIGLDEWDAHYGVVTSSSSP